MPAWNLQAGTATGPADEEGGLMALWCRHCPRASVGMPGLPRRVTLVVPFYENHEFLKTQVAHWAGLPPRLLEHLEIIVVDDGSPQPLEQLVVPGVRLRQFRIDVDVRWNWLAARNIGAHHAGGEWLLLTDMDHVVTREVLEVAIYSDALDLRTVYAFDRREHTGQDLAPHSASFLMSKAMFWRIGGYDEALSGHYGTDGEYRRRVAGEAAIAILPVPLIRHEYVADSSTVRYKRKQPEDAAVGRLVARRPKQGWRPRVMSFPYHEVLPEAICR